MVFSLFLAVEISALESCRKKRPTLSEAAFCLGLPVASIVIVNWNSGILLEQCVRSLLIHAEGSEIIVVDNASRDSSTDFIGDTGFPVTLIRNQENLGFSAANNIGWRMSKGEEVLFLNPDTESLPYAVSRLEHSLRADKAVWAVGGMLVAPDGRAQSGFNIRSFPTIGSVAAEMLLLDKVWHGNPWRRHYRMLDCDLTAAGDVDQPAAACLMLSRKALESVGGFDERFHPAWFEDVDLCKRIRGFGGRIRFEPEARFLHQGGVSLAHLTPAEYLCIYHKNQIRYFSKHYGRNAGHRVRALICTGLYLRSMLALLGVRTIFASRPGSAADYWNAARHLATVNEIAL